jgi:hypothetical protein
MSAGLHEDAVVACADKVPTSDTHELAWSAGFMDGEAHFGYNSRSAIIDVTQASDNGTPESATSLATCSRRLNRWPVQPAVPCQQASALPLGDWAAESKSRPR